MNQTVCQILHALSAARPPALVLPRLRSFCPHVDIGSARPPALVLPARLALVPPPAGNGCIWVCLYWFVCVGYTLGVFASIAYFSCTSGYILQDIPSN